MLYMNTMGRNPGDCDTKNSAYFAYSWKLAIAQDRVLNTCNCGPSRLGMCQMKRILSLISIRAFALPVFAERAPATSSPILDRASRL